MKDLKIDGRTQRVFVLREAEERIVYIPVRALHRVDYDRLKGIEATKTADDMLTVMSKTKLDNGINALVMYQNIIDVANLSKDQKQVATRVRKPTEAKPVSKETHQAPQVIERIIERVIEVPAKPQEAAKPARRKPGPRPKPKNTPQDAEGTTSVKPV